MTTGPNDSATNLAGQSPVESALRARNMRAPAKHPTARSIRDAFFSHPQEHLDIGHSRIAYRCFGDGPDILLVHGWPLHSATFRKSVAVLAEHFTCHLVDLPGTGQTVTSPGASIDLESNASVLRAVVDLLGLSSYGVIAHNSGAVAARLLVSEDDRVFGLVFSGSEIPGHHPWQVRLYKWAAQFPGGTWMFQRSLRSPIVERSSLSYGGCFHDLACMEGDFRTLFIDPLCTDSTVLAGHLQLARNVDFRVIDRLADVHASITIPTLLLWGASDPFFPVAQARAMTSQFGGVARVEVRHDAKLLVHEEHPIWFANHCRSFFGERPGRGMNRRQCFNEQKLA